MDLYSVGESVAGVRSGDGDGQALFRIASLTKAFTSAALVKALRVRDIGLDTPAIHLLPALAGDWHAERDLTVEQVLGQVSGLREVVGADTVAALGDGPSALLETARLVVRGGSEPGAPWSYYNGNYFLAGAILEAVTGKPFEQAVLEPWGLKRTGFDVPDDLVGGRDGDQVVPPSRYPRGRRPSGGLISCVDDLLTFGERLLGDVADLQEPRTSTNDPMTYGLGWALGPRGQMFLNGRLRGYRAALLMIPAHAYVAVALTNQQRALPELARRLSEMQLPLTGTDLAEAIDAFAA